MPIDGVVTKCIVSELSDAISGGRIEKIFQPERDEIIIIIRAKGQNLKLLLSASPNYPRIHITEDSRENPLVPPAFCMLLRKHLSGGKIIGVEFNNFERVIGVVIETIDEFGDTILKKLIIEIMGRFSNIILLSNEERIIDSIKHVDFEVSSVREVMPGKPYTPPPAQDKLLPSELNIDSFFENISACENIAVESFLLDRIKGFSPLLCREICHRASINNKSYASALSKIDIQNLKTALESVLAEINNSSFKPCIVFKDESEGIPTDFHCLDITGFSVTKYFDSISSVLDTYFSERDRAQRLKQKKSDLFKLLTNSLDRCKKKIALQQQKINDVEDREKLRLFGELITANIYCIPKNQKSVSLLNYYSENNEYINVELDENLSIQENAQLYFKRYQKAKSAFTHTSKQLEESLSELSYLESVLHILDNCIALHEIAEIRQELIGEGYLTEKKKSSAKKIKIASDPLHYRSSDGLEILVGKNNRQNDFLTLKLASSNDIWLHTKDTPGSHVIIKKPQADIPDNTLLEAAMLAAYHSRARLSSTVPVDYTTVRNVKKPAGAKPGMVIYENYKTLIVTPDENKVKSMSLE